MSIKITENGIYHATLEANNRLKSERDNLKLQLSKAQEQDKKIEHDLISALWTIDELKEQNDNMKCCGNCKHATIQFDEIRCPFVLLPSMYEYCKHWDMDNLTQKDRAILR